MNRRRFLQSGSLAGARPLAAGQAPVKPPALLITSAASALSRAIAAALKDEYFIRMTERVRVPCNYEFLECALAADAATHAAVRGVQAIVHAAEPLAEDTAEQRIDLLTRCTYNLLAAAADEKVQRVVLLSTLEVMAGYDPNLTVTETWRPRPLLEPRVLAKHLGELTCREFAREGKLNIVVLRLGKVVRAEEVRGKSFDPLWVEERDVVHAVSRALTSRIGPWQIFHIQPDSERSRFAVTRAKTTLGYKPQFQW